MYHSDYSSELEPVTVTPVMKRQWERIANWALYFGVLGLIGLGLWMIVISFLFYKLIQQINASPTGIVPQAGWLTLIMPGAIAVLTFVVQLFHIRFAISIKQAIRDGNQTSFELAWLNLRNHFRWYGISLILYIIISMYTFFMIQYYLNPFRAEY